MKLHWAFHQRKWWGKWHLYLGLIAGLIVSVVGVTGSMLVFRTEIDAALNPEVYHSEKTGEYLDFAEVYQALRERYPSLHVGYLMRMEGEEANYKLLKPPAMDETYVNPYTGEIIGSRGTKDSFTGVVLEIHRTLLIPVAGRYIVGLASLTLLILVITGLRLWIPRQWKNLKKSLTVKFNAGFNRQNLDWHRVTGVFASPVLTVLTLTGCCITLNMLILPLMFVFNGQSPAELMKIFGAKSDTAVHTAPLPVDEICSIYRQTFPEAELQAISFPVNTSGVYMMNAVKGSRPATGKRIMASIDQYTGEILFNSEKDLPNVAHAYLTWLQAFHFGSFGGILTKILTFLAGLIPLFLTVTGYVIWRPRSRKQKQPEEESKVVVARPSVLTEPINAWSYGWIQFKKGLKYGVRCMLAALIGGLLFGIWGGVTLEPMAFIIVFTCLLSVVNLIVALFAFLFYLLTVPFRKGNRAMLRYFAWSLAFSVVFGIGYLVITQSGIEIF